MDPLLPLLRAGQALPTQSGAALVLNTPYPAQLEVQDGTALLVLRSGTTELRLSLLQLPELPLGKALTATLAFEPGQEIRILVSQTGAAITLPLTAPQRTILLQPQQLIQLTQQLNRGESPLLDGKPILTPELRRFLTTNAPITLQLSSHGTLSVQTATPRTTQSIPLSSLKEPAVIQSLLATRLPLMKQSQTAEANGNSMKTLNLDKVLQLSGANIEQNNVRLQPGVDYYARLQVKANQAADLVVQTPQGVLRLPLQQVPPLPPGLPLLLNFQQLNAERLTIQVKVLTGIATEIPLTATQARLLQEPKQLAMLQQQLSRGEVPAQLAGEPLKLPATLSSNTQPVNLQLQPASTTSTAAGSTFEPKGILLSVQPVAAEQVLQLNNKDFLKPLPWQSNQGAATATSGADKATNHVAEQGWRQLLPLLSSSPARLAALPEMPAAVVALLQQVRQAQPGGNQVLSVSEIQQQLQAVLQFQPLQAQPNLSTGAGTLAVAIQLLLGHLLRQPLSDNSKAGGKIQQLAQQIGQLDNQQASQLLRALGSHSSLLQLSQLQNADLPQLNQQWFIPLALQQHQESRFSEILLEQREAEKKPGAEKQKLWQLTMKFDLGQYGQLLAVAKLAGQDLQLQFYTDQPAALRQAEKFLPLLTERCQAQGIQVSQAACQLGKIPDTLGSRRTSLIATQA
ncbi:hypothetical protein AGRI_04837 [Alishewanella agri BL06]|uniref:Flagellar hook-length control protein-like C-terminal domain-containing protein n=1 Tax=Alishewanella agri BL06 TaxID=1195246 RepID=I9P3K8_9ALTE|nr:flagellar hook-length control protein FliK [Alishewanella agri]EIW89399.1 hypothetical protein AGRI_04837 [Alishewanella agri BL06]